MIAFSSMGRIYISAPDGSNARRVPGGPALAWRPTWSGDSSRLVYTGGGHGGGLAIHVHDLRSGESWKVLHVGEWLVPLPSLSPDGSTIMFTALIHGTFGLYTVASTGGEPTLLLRDAAFGSYAPNTDRIVYLKAGAASGRGPTFVHSGPIVADLDGGRPVEIGPGVGGWPGVDGLRWDFFRPMWSPDGTRVAYMPPSPSAFSSGARITVGDVETGATMPTPLSGYWPTWFDRDTLAIQTRR
jgi:Tol biopolymer transport system component